VHGELGAEILIATRGFDGVDVADEVGYGDVGGGEFFYVTLVWGEPRDGGFVAEFCELIAAELGDRSVGVVADFGAGDVWEIWVEEGGQGAKDARLCLSAETEEDEVVLAEDGVDDLGDDGVVVADDAREEGDFIVGAAGTVVSGAAKFGDEVPAQLVFDASGHAGWSEFAGAEGAESCRERGRHGSSIDVRPKRRVQTGGKTAFARGKRRAQSFHPLRVALDLSRARDVAAVVRGEE